MKETLPKRVEDLVQSLHDKDPEIRKSAAGRLRLYGERHERIISALTAVAEVDTNKSVRNEAGQALLALGQAPEQLQSSLASSSLGQLPADRPMPIDAIWLGRWLQALQDEQQEQTKKLASISRSLNFFVVLAVIGLILGGCSVLLSLPTR